MEHEYSAQCACPRCNPHEWLEALEEQLEFHQQQLPSMSVCVSIKEWKDQSLVALANIVETQKLIIEAQDLIISRKH